MGRCILYFSVGVGALPGATCDKWQIIHSDINMLHDQCRIRLAPSRQAWDPHCHANLKELTALGGGWRTNQIPGGTASCTCRASSPPSSPLSESECSLRSSPESFPFGKAAFLLLSVKKHHVQSLWATAFVGMSFAILFWENSHSW